MEKKQARPLAYQLARTLKPEEIEKISGGSMPAAIKPTFRITGAQSADVVTDF